MAGGRNIIGLGCLMSYPGRQSLHALIHPRPAMQPPQPPHPLHPAAATHPTTFPMMCPRLSHSWPLGYRLRSSPQLLSPCGAGEGIGPGQAAGWCMRWNKGRGSGQQFSAAVADVSSAAAAGSPNPAAAFTIPQAAQHQDAPAGRAHLCEYIEVAAVVCPLVHLDDSVHDGNLPPVGVEHNCKQSSVMMAAGSISRSRNMSRGCTKSC